jgi:uncharacterized protein (DUF1778 family)
MATKEIITKDARFDTRITKQQKDFFEKAAQLGGFRNLTDFVVSAIQEKAKEIIDERERVIASQKDGEIFFEAILHPKNPNNELTKAANEFKSLFS